MHLGKYILNTLYFVYVFIQYGIRHNVCSTVHVISTLFFILSFGTQIMESVSMIISRIS